MHMTFVIKTAKTNQNVCCLVTKVVCIPHVLSRPRYFLLERDLRQTCAFFNLLPRSSHSPPTGPCCDHPLRSGATFVCHTSSYVPTWPRQDVIWYSALKYPPHWGKVCCQVCNVSSSSSSQAVGQNVSSEVSVVGPLLLEQAALHNWPLAQDAPPWRARAWPTENRGAWTCCRLRLLCKWDILRSYIQK